MALKLNQLAGFGGGGDPPFGIRRVGGYAVTFPASITGSFTVPAIDLSAPASNKQILLFACHESSTPIHAVVGGLTYKKFAQENWLARACLIAFPFTGGGAISGSLILNSSQSADGWVEVFEVFGAVPLYKSPNNSNGSIGGTSVATTLKMVTGDMILNCLMANIDTTTVTWSNQNEVFDGDAGTFRVSSALAGPSGSTVDFTATATLSGADDAVNYQVDIQPADRLGVKGGYRGVSAATIASSAFSYPSTAAFLDVTGMGSGDLVIAFANEGNAAVSAVTWGGVAMTLRGAVSNTAASPDLNISLWSIPFTQASPTGAIAATMSGSGANGLPVFAIPFVVYDVGSWGSAAAVQGNSTGSNAAVNRVLNGMTLAFTIRASNSVMTWTGVLEIIEATFGTPFAISVAQSYFDAAGTGVAVGATGASEQWATLVVPINP